MILGRQSPRSLNKFTSQELCTDIPRHNLSSETLTLVIFTFIQPIANANLKIIVFIADTGKSTTILQDYKEVE